MSMIKRYAKREHNNFALLLIARQKLYAARAAEIQADSWTPAPASPPTSGRLGRPHRHRQRNLRGVDTTTQSSTANTGAWSHHPLVYCALCLPPGCTFARPSRAPGPGTTCLYGRSGVRSY